MRKRLYIAVMDLEKGFDLVPRKVILWAIRKLGVEEWIVKLVREMNENVKSGVRVVKGLSEEFAVKVGVHQGSVLSPQLFIIVLEIPPRELRVGIPWEDMYVITADSLVECIRRLLLWKKGIYGREGPESEHRESIATRDQDHDLWYRTGPIAELRRVPMC